MLLIEYANVADDEIMKCLEHICVEIKMQVKHVIT